MSLLPSPYGDCRQAENYTFQRCISHCVGNYVLSKCKCRPLELEGIALQSTSDRFDLLLLFACVRLCKYFSAHLLQYNAIIRLIKQYPVDTFANRCTSSVAYTTIIYPQNWVISQLMGQLERHTRNRFQYFQCQGIELL